MLTTKQINFDVDEKRMLGVDVEGEVMWLVGHLVSNGRPVVQLGNSPTYYSLDSILKFAEPDDWHFIGEETE